MSTSEDRLAYALDEIARLSRLIDSIGDAIFVWDHHGMDQEKMRDLMRTIGDKIRTWSKEG